MGRKRDFFFNEGADDSVRSGRESFNNYNNGYSQDTFDGKDYDYSFTDSFASNQNNNVRYNSRNQAYEDRQAAFSYQNGKDEFENYFKDSRCSCELGEQKKSSIEFVEEDYSKDKFRSVYEDGFLNEYQNAEFTNEKGPLSWEEEDFFESHKADKEETVYSPAEEQQQLDNNPINNSEKQSDYKQPYVDYGNNNNNYLNSNGGYDSYYAYGNNGVNQFSYYNNRTNYYSYENYNNNYSYDNYRDNYSNYDSYHNNNESYDNYRDNYSNYGSNNDNNQSYDNYRDDYSNYGSNDDNNYSYDNYKDDYSNYDSYDANSQSYNNYENNYSNYDSYNQNNGSYRNSRDNYSNDYNYVSNEFSYKHQQDSYSNKEEQGKYHNGIAKENYAKDYSKYGYNYNNNSNYNYGYGYYNGWLAVILILFWFCGGWGFCY